jgi:small subunit ribosomal protein S7
MARRNSAKKRKIEGDPRYGNVVVAKFMNCLMYEGKKTVAESIVYDALDAIQAKAGKDCIELFNQALDNVRPGTEVRSKRVGGATYQVPTAVNPTRSQALAIRWLINAARSRAEKGMKERLAAELLDAANGKGGAVKKRDDTHKMAEANRAFAHYSW